MRAFIYLPFLLLSGCGLQAIGGIQPGGISGTAAGLFGIPSATISAQMVQEMSDVATVVTAAQMLKMRLDGAPLPALPAPAPTPVPTPTPTPGGPIVTPN